jgi:hypothetical protein
MTTQELQLAREDFLAKFRKHYPESKDFTHPAYKLARLRKNTGFRGVRWFYKGDIILAGKYTDGSIRTFSWHPLWNINHGPCPEGLKNAIIGRCALPNDKALEWLE